MTAYDDLLSELSDLENELSNLETELSDRDNDLAACRARLSDKGSTIKALMKDVEAAKAEAALYRETINTLSEGWKETLKELKEAREALHRVYKHSTVMAEAVLELHGMSKPEGDKQQWPN